MDWRRRALLGAAAGSFLGTAYSRNALLSKTIPASGEALPVIGLGTWQSFDVGTAGTARAPLGEVLKALAGAGPCLVDSSPMYGASEAVAGELMGELGLRRKLFIATKVWTSGRDEGIRQMEASFRKLRVERMDLMQIHNLVDAATHAKTLKEMKDKQRIRYAGITHYAASAHREVGRWLDTRQFDFVQINYSLAEPQAEKALLPKARDLKVAVIVNRPFGEGALFARVRGKALPPWAAELGIASWAQYFLKWIVSHPAVTCAIPGTGNPAHMRDNLGAGTGPLPDEAARNRMRAHFESL